MSHSLWTGRPSWTHKFLSVVLSAATLFPSVGPGQARAVEPALATRGSPAKLTAPQIRDTALDAAGMLRGQVVDRQGHPLKNSTVAVLDGTKEVARTTSNANGDFAFRIYHGGLLQLATREDAVLCRVWSHRAAPPSAQKGILLCGGGSSVRGQCNCAPSCCQCCPPAPTVTVEELRELAPDLPEGQYAAFLGADVVITNPDHYSVVIAYDPATGNAVVVAKGTDALALQMQAAARAAGIPVVQNPPLARALYESVAVGGSVPADLLGQVTGIISNLTPPAQPVEQSFQPTGGRSGFSQIGVLGVGIIAAAVIIPVATLSNQDDAS